MVNFSFKMISTSSLLLTLLLISTSHAFLNPISQQMIDTIKDKATTWTPMELTQNPLAKRDPFTIIQALGSKGMDTHTQTEHVQVSNDIPESFSAIDKWPDCIIPVQNQELWGADWAFIPAEILSERYCIQSNGTEKVVLSVNHILACDEKDWGCSGGYPDRAWDFLSDDGVLTDEWFPFESKDGHRAQCPFQEKWVSSDDVEYKKYYSQVFKWFNGEANIQTEIMSNGPVQTEFQVYGDFLNYKEGVYQHTTGGKLGFYSAKIVGWGVENDVKYWVAASVFGEEWGEKGYFRMLRGSNECNFETNAIAGDADPHRLD